ncbi:MAG: pinensin family lanthipeptide [Saprospiraceae bacterium]|nr:pinensin family lanthipeptide [Saprospiraceae bacterium]
MAKEKITLEDLKMESFVTALESDQMHQIKGGIYIIRGRRFTYRTRWTAVDTRSDTAEAAFTPGQK